MESYNVWSFVTGFFQLARCPQGSSMLQYVTEFPSFLRLNRIPSCRLTTCCLSLHQLMGMRVVSTFWLLLLRTFESRFLWGRVFSCLGHILRTLIAGPYANSVVHHLGAATLVSQAAALFSFPAAAYEGSNFPISSPTLVVPWQFYSSPPSSCEVISGCG